MLGIEKVECGRAIALKNIYAKVKNNQKLEKD